jgi:hypothetical protein
VNNSVKNNSKALKTTACNTEQYKNSFFVKSVIHWNQLEEEIVHAKTVEKNSEGFIAGAKPSTTLYRNTSLRLVLLS